MEFQSYHAIIACVAAGSGLAVVPRAVLDLARANHNVTITVLPAKISKARTQLVWRREHHSSALEAMKSLFGRRNSTCCRLRALCSIRLHLRRVGKLVPPKRQILKNISLNFFPGAKIGVLGLNGSGSPRC